MIIGWLHEATTVSEEASQDSASWIDGVSAVGSVLGALFALGALVVAAYALRIQLQDRKIRLRVLSQDHYDSDGKRMMDDVTKVNRFVIQNAGEKGINIRSISVDTLPNEPESIRSKSAIGVGMEVVDGPKPSGRLEPGMF